jgi:hypothetical protein
VATHRSASHQIVPAAAAVWFVTESLGNNVERVPNAFASV